MAEQTEQYDPTQHTVAEVQDHLRKADPEEFLRVLVAEEAGQGRKGILDFTVPLEAATEREPDEDGYVRVPVPDAYTPGEPLDLPVTEGSVIG